MKLSLLLLLVTSNLALAERHTESAEEMLSACEGLSTAKIVGDAVALPSDFETGKCWGAFSTLYRLSKLVVGQAQGRRDALPFLPVCSPAETTTTQYLAIFVQFSKANPQKLHKEFLVVAIEALTTAFPCAVH
jgi:hypothetical protein